MDREQSLIAKDISRLVSIFENNAKANTDKESSEKIVSDKLNSIVSVIKNNSKLTSEIIDSKSKNDLEKFDKLITAINQTNNNLIELSKLNSSKTVEEDVIKSGSSASAIVSMESFKEFSHIVEANGRTFMTAKVFCNETPTSFEFCFADSIAMYECTVMKSDIKNEKDFRLQYVTYSFKGKLK